MSVCAGITQVEGMRRCYWAVVGEVILVSVSVRFVICFERGGKFAPMQLTLLNNRVITVSGPGSKLDKYKEAKITSKEYKQLKEVRGTREKASIYTNLCQCSTVSYSGVQNHYISAHVS